MAMSSRSKSASSKTNVRRKSFSIASDLARLSKPFSAISNEISGTRITVPIQRCVKYSPNVKPRPFEQTSAQHAFEAMAWTNAFNSMGKLKERGLQEAIVTHINKDPYHCNSLAREFEVGLGSQPKHDTLTISNPAKSAEIKKAPNYLTIGMMNLPPKIDPIKTDSIPKWLILGIQPKQGLYLPPSSVRVRLGPDVMPNFDVICEWLIKRFGHFLFMVREGPKSMIVVYEDIWSAYRLVNSNISLRYLNITWCDPRFNNFGHLNCYQRYTVSTDPVWMQHKEATADRHEIRFKK